MERSGFAPVAIVGLGAFMLGAVLFGGAATAGAATAGAAVMWPFFALVNVLVVLLVGFIARAFWGRGWDRRPHHGGPRGPYGRHGWPGPWAPPRAEPQRRGDRDDDDDETAQDPRAWFEQRAEDWHLKAHARMDIDGLVPDPTRDHDTGGAAADDRDVV